MQSTNGYWLKSSLFAAEPGEDDESNPRLYGRQLASWIRQRFQSLGYPVEEVHAEDWGWCVMCQRDPYSLFIGCVSLADYEYARPGDPPPPTERLLWQVLPMAEMPPFKYLLRRKPDMQEGLARFDAQLRSTLESEPAIQIVDDSVANTWFADLPKVSAVPHADDEATGLPRWMQVIAGVLLLPMTLLCVGGSLTMFSGPRIQTDPLVQFMTVVISALSVWGLMIAVRLIFGLKGKYGLLGPFALRVMSAVAMGAVVGSFFTRIYVEHPIRAAAFAILYVVASIRFWRSADRKRRTS
jgi:hypothetical protein